MTALLASECTFESRQYLNGVGHERLRKSSQGGSSDGAGGSRRGPCCWLARRSPRWKCKTPKREIASGVTDDWMAGTRLGGRRVRNGPRRACAWAGGEATLRALVFAVPWSNAMDRVPEVSLRRRRVLLVAVRSSPCGAAWGNVTLAMNAAMAFAMLAKIVAISFVITRCSHGPANAITLSCKSRLTRRAAVAARRLPQLTRSGRSGLQTARRAPGGGGAPR